MQAEKPIIQAKVTHPNRMGFGWGILANGILIDSPTRVKLAITSLARQNDWCQAR